MFLDDRTLIDKSLKTVGSPSIAFAGELISFVYPLYANFTNKINAFIPIEYCRWFAVPFLLVKFALNTFILLIISHWSSLLFTERLTKGLLIVF